MKQAWKTPVIEKLDITQTMGGGTDVFGDCTEANNSSQQPNPTCPRDGENGGS
ncbi:hypothetical protein [Alkalicoccus luteus]|uniref:Paeninodin family lasso peptide n=1 Tax=Alkalicoccus luteus TaxID=1237094 RepID=A0A969PV19_9BACI|nr:hypothetical protein [Alkalicoccus luteus]NJP38029.1 hypothetical protein [Alkalicoccus luteus]